MSADISVLVVNWNTRDLVLECLDALPAAVGDDVMLETIVVDNGSADGSAEALADRSDVVLIVNDENRGFAEGVNQAYLRATGEFVLLLNSDVKARPGALRVLIEFLRARPDVAGAAPLYVNPDGSPQPFHFRFPTFWTCLINGSSLVQRLHPRSERIMQEYRMTQDDFSKPRSVEQPSASCLLLRASSLPAGGLLDECYPIFFNDVKLALTLAASGHRLWVVPDSVVVHEAHSSAKMMGDVIGRRHYIGSTVRLLKETEPRLKVRSYQVLVFCQNAVLRLLRRPEALYGSELRRALAGDPGRPPAGRPIRRD